MEKLLEALAVTLELTGTQVSEGAVRVMARDLAGYPLPGILGALDRCRKECKGRLTVADVISRIDDGRPGPEEAWAIVSPTLADERLTVVWTLEMQAAFGAALPLADDPIAARMAFLEVYRRELSQARTAGAPVHWQASLGTDASGRDGPLTAAAQAGRLGWDHVQRLLPGASLPDGRLLAEIKRRALT